MTADSSQPPREPTTVSRFLRGSVSFLRFLIFPLGRWAGRHLPQFATPDRRDKGLVIVLPGIEGKSFVNIDVVLGLADGGVESAIELFDWTTGIFPLWPYHLRALKRNRRVAERIAERIVEYQDRYPGRPVHLVGHSGGTGIAVFALEALPPDRRITAAVLLASALSPRYDLAAALSRTERGIWSFRSPFDALFLVLGTLLIGTIDGRHRIAAGNGGFADDAGPQLHQVRYRASMMRAFHFGGHCGWTNRVFVAETIAPLVRQS